MRGREALAAMAVAIGTLAAAPVAGATVFHPACAGIQTDLDTAATGDVIQLPPGTCAVNLTVNVDTSAFTLQGDPSGSTLSPSSSASPIIQSGEPVKLTISGVTFTGASGQPAVLLQAPGEAVTFIHDTFSGNTYSGGSGGAISIQTQSEPGTLATQPTVISQSTFANNSASAGGAIALLGQNPLTVTGNRFTANQVGAQGGAIDVFGGTATPASPVLISGNTFGGPATSDGNTSADEGGAVALYPGSSGQPITVSDNVFAHNAVTGSAFYDREGGALYIAGGSPGNVPVTQSHNQFSDNRIAATELHPTPARLAAGAAEFALAASVISYRDTFTGNRVDTHDGVEPWGGAVGAYADSGTTELPGVFAGTDDLFSGNSTSVGGWGGAIYVGGPPGSCTGSCPPSSLSLHDSTVTGNTVDAGAGSEGGAIWGSPQDHLRIDNSIVYGNTPPPDIFGFTAGAPVIQYSDVCAGAGGPSAPAGAHDICADPKLDLTGRETFQSPTLDTGANALVPAGTTTDLAGNPRIVPDRAGCFGPPAPAVVDMGAFEYNGPIPVPPCPPPVRITLVTIGGKSLALAHGRVPVTLSCRGAGSRCRGRVTLTTVRRYRAADVAKARKPRRKAQRIVLGSATYSLATGRTVTVGIRVSGRALARLGRATSLPVIVAVTNTPPTNPGAGAMRTMTLRLPRHPARHRSRGRR